MEVHIEYVLRDRPLKFRSRAGPPLAPRPHFGHACLKHTVGVLPLPHQCTVGALLIFALALPNVCVCHWCPPNTKIRLSPLSQTQLGEAKTLWKVAAMTRRPSFLFLIQTAILSQDLKLIYWRERKNKADITNRATQAFQTHTHTHTEMNNRLVRTCSPQWYPFIAGQPAAAQIRWD